jgi:hypothetical protein
MFRRVIASPPRSLSRWCGYALILLTPGSFIVLPLFWLLKVFGFQASR